MNTSAKTVSLPFFQSFGCYIIYFGTGPHADDNNFHTAFRAMQDINNTNAQTAELDLQAPGKLASFFVSQRFSISAFIVRQRILANLLYGAENLHTLASVKRTQILLSFIAQDDFPTRLAHSISTSSHPSKSFSVTPNSVRTSSKDVPLPRGLERRSAAICSTRKSSSKSIVLS